MPKTIYEDYFDFTKKHRNQYGTNTVVFMQVGAFYEVYGASKIYSQNDDDDNEISSDISLIQDFANICGFKIAQKSERVSMYLGTYRLYMAGFRDDQLEKHLPKMMDEGFTIPIYNQDINGKNATRSLSVVHSPGTYMPIEDSRLSNHVLSLWLDVNVKHSKINIAIAGIDSSTSKSFMKEYLRDFYHQPTTYDDIQRNILMYSPCEIICIGNLPSKQLHEVLQYVNIKCKSIHVKSTISTDEHFDEKVIRCDKQIQQYAIIEEFFKDITPEFFLEKYRMLPLATQSFCFLLDFIQSHNARLLFDIEQPTLNSDIQSVVLANNCLEQLNVIEPYEQLNIKKRNQNHSRSLISLLDECVTTIGRREYYLLFQNPITNATSLNQSYHLIEHILTKQNSIDKQTSASGVFMCSNNYVHSIRNILKKIYDIECIKCKIHIKRITPRDIHVLHQNILACKELYLCIKTDKVLSSFIEQSLNIKLRELITSFDKLCNFIQKYFDIDLCYHEEKHQPKTNIFKPGNYNELDKKQNILLHSDGKINGIYHFINGLIGKTERKKNDTEEKEYIKLHVNEKTATTLLITKRRSDILQKTIQKYTNPLVDIEYKVNVMEHGEWKTSNQTMTFDLKDISFENQSSKKDSNMLIRSSLLNSLLHDLFYAKETMSHTLIQVFDDVIHKCLQNHKKTIDKAIQFIREMDILQCKAYMAEKRNLSKPIICESLSSYVKMEGLRHCLVENTNSNEVYVTNDIQLGSLQPPSNFQNQNFEENMQSACKTHAKQTDKKETEESVKPNESQLGFLLYGTNAVGKTCLIKAIGMAVIMAQAGFYVPCTKFEFSPYEYIFTRIVNRDDLFKGLSTFAMEMSELRTILDLCNHRSLVLGDELCSGTENVSAISIFIAGLEKLYKEKSSFVFATHFHELQFCKDIQNMTMLGMKHMRVHYDTMEQKLIYNRRLEDGAGDAMYGLEVCRSLSMPCSFLERAHQIRANLSTHSELVPSILSQKKSRYSSKKLMGVCEICKKYKSVDTHHKIHQKTASTSNGFIEKDGNVFHKDVPANLQAICAACHKKQHS